MTTQRFPVVCALLALGWAAAQPGPGWSQSPIELYMDLDHDPATGCTVTTVDGPFTGVEQILLSRQRLPPGVAPPPDERFDVAAPVLRRDCTDPATDTFGPWVRVDLGGWPVGSGLDGSRALESYWPLSAAAGPVSAIRLGVQVGDDDALLGLSFSLRGASVLTVPTLSEWGAMLLALLLAALAVRRLKPGPRAAWLLLVAALAVSTAAWAACVLDGELGDWTSDDLVGLDPIGDVGPRDSDLRALFAQQCTNRVCLRFDWFQGDIQVPPASLGEPASAQAQGSARAGDAPGSGLGPRSGRAERVFRPGPLPTRGGRESGRRSATG